MTSKPSARVFEDLPATRENIPLLVGIVGASSTGKTFSALRLATGIQRVSGGEVFGIDTEARRMRHYAERFRFRHVSFGAPFSPLDYLSAIDHCIAKGAKVIVVDSMSHEHEGPGGVLEMHEAELDRIAGNDWKKREAVNMLAWARPKQQRRRLINSLLQKPCNFVFCFRAKEKIKPVRGGQPINMGWQPIAGGEFIYEMTVNFWLHPGANGTPAWKSDHQDEQAMMKRPEQFRALLETPGQLSEDIGEQMARWAAGGSAQTPVSAADLVARYAACSDAATLRTLEDVRAASWAKLGKDDKARVKQASADAAERVARAERTFEESAADDDADQPPPDDEADELARHEAELLRKEGQR